MSLNSVLSLHERIYNAFATFEDRMSAMLKPCVAKLARSSCR